MTLLALLLTFAPLHLIAWYGIRQENLRRKQLLDRAIRIIQLIGISRGGRNRGQD